MNIDGKYYTPTAKVTINATNEVTGNSELTNTADSIVSALKTNIAAVTLPGNMTVTKLPTSLELSFTAPTVTKTPTGNGGSAGTDSTYTNVATTTGGSGSGLTVDVRVESGVAT